jgi:SPP1 gp7 family putative phage head morphogenesis protein
VKKNLGGHVEGLQQAIEDEFGFSARRANLIARDQVLKLNGQLTQTRQVNAGIEEYIWTTSGDERVRDEHKDKEGQTFSWNDPPPDTGHPAEDYQCRCTAFPIIPELQDEQVTEATGEDATAEP